MPKCAKIRFSPVMGTISEAIDMANSCKSGRRMDASLLDGVPPIFRSTSFRFSGHKMMLRQVANEVTPCGVNDVMIHINDVG